FAELQPLVTDFTDHPWDWAAEQEGVVTPRHWEGNRWNAKKDMSFVPLRPERVLEVRYDYMEGYRFRHTTQFVRWRPDREPHSSSTSSAAMSSPKRCGPPSQVIRRNPRSASAPRALARSTVLSPVTTTSAPASASATRRSSGAAAQVSTIGGTGESVTNTDPGSIEQRR